MELVSVHDTSRLKEGKPRLKTNWSSRLARAGYRPIALFPEKKQKWLLKLQLFRSEKRMCGHLRSTGQAFWFAAQIGHCLLLREAIVAWCVLLLFWVAVWRGGWFCHGHRRHTDLQISGQFIMSVTARDRGKPEQKAKTVEKTLRRYTDI